MYLHAAVGPADVLVSSVLRYMAPGMNLGALKALLANTYILDTYLGM